MKITLNGKEETLTEEVKLIDFLTSKGLEPERLVVEYNGKVASKEEWDNIILKDNDVLEVLRFVGGG